jgi:hypothetical protein
MLLNTLKMQICKSKNQYIIIIFILHIIRYFKFKYHKFLISRYYKSIILFLIDYI